MNGFIFFVTVLRKTSETFFDKWELVKDEYCWLFPVYFWLFDLLQNVSFAFITIKGKSTFFGVFWWWGFLINHANICEGPKVYTTYMD